jgi:hypothetical protein
MGGKRLAAAVPLALFVVSILSCTQGGAPTMPADSIRLPKTIDGWKLEGPPRRIDATNIFDYMDGAGELYLSYHFDHLMAYEYKGDGGNDILVELYDMEGSRDAFGLLSLDWGGETVKLSGRDEEGPGVAPIVPSSRALYGEGLLRIWSDDLYVRILAASEGPGVRDAVLRLGEAIVAGRKNPAPPELLRAVDPGTDATWTLRKDRTTCFYSHLVLNSLYYISHENILSLGPDTEAVMVTFEREREGEAKRSARLMVVRYPDEGRVAAGLAGFMDAYLPEKAREGEPEKGQEKQGFVEVEDGWLGYRTAGRYLALAFGCPDEGSAREILGRAVIK